MNCCRLWNKHSMNSLDPAHPVLQSLTRLLVVALMLTIGRPEATCLAQENDPADPAGELTVAQAVSWLEAEAHRLIRASRREMADGTAAFPPQVGSHYEAFWLRDYQYSLEGSVASYSNAELTAACRLFVEAIDSRGAAVDCIKFDGTPIYRPAYGSMGKHPVADGAPFTVGVAWHTFQKAQDNQLLVDTLDPLQMCMRTVPRNAENGLVHIDPAETWDRCPYGFTDTIRKQGDVLFCSLLFIQASQQLAELLREAARVGEAEEWSAEAERVSNSVRAVFWDEQADLFRAATVKCREHDIWGSAFAVFLGVASDTQSMKIARYFQQHYSELVEHGQVRHLPGGTYWEQGCARDRYQNGAFWGTPVGWFVYTLDQVDPALADRTILDLVRHYRQHGACEWIVGDHCQLKDYLASAALPLSGIRKMLRRRSED